MASSQHQQPQQQQAPPALDFEALLSREYRPALVTRLIPREKYNPDEARTAGGNINKRKHRNSTALGQQQQQHHLQNAETSRFVLSLVEQTPAFTRHSNPAAGKKQQDQLASTPSINSFLARSARPPTAAAASYHRSHNSVHDILPKFHEIELGDWESKIDWQGASASKHSSNDDDTDTQRQQPQPQQPPKKVDALALLERPRNHFLDSLVFDESTVAWNAGSENAAALLKRARNAPLILELGVAGQSVARHVYQNTTLSAQRPQSATQSAAYRNRLERDWRKNNGGGGANAGHDDAAVSASGKALSKKEKEKAMIAERQKKRAETAKEKTRRVADAMGTMSMGGGQGRTVTSSLMGPGGTERTGRPNKVSNGGFMEQEYIEQLDLVATHALLRGDWSKVQLRQYMRPKLPRSVVRPGLAWQLQIRSMPTSASSAGKKSNQAQHSSFQPSVSISKERLRTEADLSPTEGNLILLEYVEERPPIQLTKGMCSKIVNYYRGDRARCPVSAGGGDRPARRNKRADGSSTGASGKDGTRSKNDRLPRLQGPNQKTNIADWVGPLPKKQNRSEQEATIDIMPEGVSEILHPKQHGPFIGGVDEGMTISGLVSNLFVAPIFRHEPESTDFLCILQPPGGASRPGQRDQMGIILRDLPASVFTVGQTEPRTKVQAPNSQGEKNFVNEFISYQMARALTRAQSREGHGLRFDEIQDRVLPSLELQAASLRPRLKHVAIFDKVTQIWTTKRIGYEDYVGVDALGRSIAPEGVAAFESASAARRRLQDLGIEQLTEKGTVLSIGVTMVYLAGQLNSAREISKKVKKLGELSKSNKSVRSMQVKCYEKASEVVESYYKSLRQKHEVATFIYEELQLTPWNLTGEFIDVHKKGEGTGMLKLTGLGDPSGMGEGFSFLREADPKPTKAVAGNPAEKITGTEDDLRKLTMTQMAALLRSYGMGQKQIDTLKRWDRVHVIRDLSTKAASDGIGDGLERFARGEKMKLSEQKQMYTERIKVIWHRMIAALSAPGDRAMEVAGGVDGQDASAPAADVAMKKSADTDKDGSESDSDDDDFAAALEDEMVDRSEANQLVVAHTRTGESDGGLGQIRAATLDKDMTKDARELAALKRQREEERVANEGLKSNTPKGGFAPDANANVSDRKVVRIRITKTHPDGRVTTKFKFITHPSEVGKIMARLQEDPNHGRRRNLEPKYEYGEDERPPGHAMFENEDNFDYSSNGRQQSGRQRGGAKRRGGQARPRSRNLQIGRLKTKTSNEDRIRKRKQEDDELDVYVSTAKRKGTSNRRERGSIRDRRAHVILAEKLETIRRQVESRPSSGPFHKAVNVKLIPRYYEMISHPMDLTTIRKKIAEHLYRTTDSFIQDFELMRKNAVKFNGPVNPIALEAIAIHDFVSSQVNANRKEYEQLEEEVEEFFQGDKPKKKKQKTGKSKKKNASSTSGNVGGVNLGDLSGLMGGGSDTDSYNGDLLDGL